MARGGGPVQEWWKRSASCGGVRGAEEGERSEGVCGTGKPGGMLCRMARLLEESGAVGSMRYCPQRPGPVGTNWSSRRGERGEGCQ